MGVLGRIFGDDNTRALKRVEARLREVNAHEETTRALSDKELKSKATSLRSRLAEGKTLDDLLPEAFAAVREASRRTLGQRHYDVQIIGGIVLHEGGIAEMRTGEGKTLAATLPVYLNALADRGVHVVTVNDYLARRDAVWMGQVYAFLGLSVGVVNGQNQSFLYDPGHTEVDQERDAVGSFKIVYEFLRPCTKREAYRADITYGTNSEFGFDYLRDNTAYTRDQLSQRPPDEGGFSYAIVDEIDSILIDEARTPLIIAMPSAESEDLYVRFTGIARSLEEGKHYEVDEKRHAVTLTDEGIERAEALLGVENIYTDAGIKYVHHLETALRAKALYHRDKEYVVREGEVVIVDEFTGRMQPGRRWSEGLHQAVEAKEGVRIRAESRTAASITYQNYFRQYEKLAGMTGTAETSAEEFYKVYGLETVVIPTHRPMVREDRNDLIFQSERGKFDAVARKVKELNALGQPVLIGTVSVENNERLSEHLRREGIPHEVLNAKNHEQEGEIIAQAGRKGAVTIATNVAGRGGDIKLGGGTAIPEAHEEVKRLGGLFVLGTERHDARRIDNQLRGRSCRQGEPGASQFFVSLEDKLMRVFATDVVKSMMGRLNIPEDEPIENKIITRSLESAQAKIEGFHFDARKHVLEFDDVLNTQRASVYVKRRAMLLGSPEDVYAVLDEFTGSDEAYARIIAEKKSVLGEESFVEALRRLVLQAIDTFWIEHLEVMDYLRSSVNLRAYGQRDPLIEYRKEGKRLFDDMQAATAAKVLELLPMVQPHAFERDAARLAKQHERMRTVGGDSSAGSGQVPVKKEREVGRNDPCPCGSGKKYKKCGLLNTEEHQSLIAKGK